MPGTVVQLRSRAVRSADAETVAVAAAAAGSCEQLPLVDRLQRRVRYLRVSVTDRCNYRCTYCMPAGAQDYGPRDAVLRLEEIVAVVEAFAAAGVERVRLTGGEPTGRRGIVELVAALCGLRGAAGPLQVVMTTNGETLARLARPLRDAGLAAITVSLDSLQPDRFAAITRRGRLDHVLAGIDAALAAGLPLKTNTVAVRGFNDDELGGIARFAWARGATPRFIELMPMSSGALFVPGELMPAAAVRERIAAELDAPLVPATAAVAGLGPARYVAVSRGPWADKLVGTIGAMTENFCAGCNRVRLSATGQLHGCLGHDDAGDLRRALREQGRAAMADVVARVLGTKRDGHGFHVDGTGGPRKSMISIGG